MGSASEYEKRAKQCAEPALAVTGTVDRVRWLQLAEGWELLSRMPIQRVSSQRTSRRDFGAVNCQGIALGRRKAAGRQKTIATATSTKMPNPIRATARGS
jgi:hypothetical protein